MMKTRKTREKPKSLFTIALEIRPFGTVTKTVSYLPQFFLFPLSLRSGGSLTLRFVPHYKQGNIRYYTLENAY